MYTDEVIEQCNTTRIEAPPFFDDDAFISQEAVARMLSRIVPNDGNFQTAIPFLSFIRASQPTHRTPSIIQPSLCLVLQGGKRSFIGKEILYYDAGCFLVASLDLPVSGYVVDASPSKPYLSIKLTITP